MTIRTTDGFWRGYDRNHEALPKHSEKTDGLKTTQSRRTWVSGFTCATCGMPSHLEHKLIDLGLIGVETLPAAQLAFGRDVQNAWVPRHGPAPYSSNMYREELRGRTPVIELPDATVMVDVSQGKRHLPVRHTERKLGAMTVANLLCATVPDLSWKLDLGDCWQAEVCKLCLENPSQI
jgi:hypothetical protein